MVSGGGCVHNPLALLVGGPFLFQVTLLAGPPVDSQVSTPDDVL